MSACARLGLLGIMALVSFTAVAHAHGRPPRIGQLAFHPTDPDTIVARATWGMVISVDHGVSWRWICAATMGFDPTRENPPILVMPDGAVLVGGFNGLSRSAPDRCAWDRPDEDLDNVFVIDLAHLRSAPAVVFAAVTNGGGPDGLFRSDDMGVSFEAVGAPIDDVLVERVRLSETDPQRVYLSGAIPANVDNPNRRGFFFRSTDGGATLTPIEIALMDEERNVHVEAVDPTDPDRVLVRITRRSIDTRGERLLLTEDGGDSFVTAMSARAISAVAFSDDGARAWVSTNEGEGLFRSIDGGASFTAIVAGSVLDVESRSIAGAEELWLAVDELRDDYAIGLSLDDGDAIAERLHFREIRELPGCPRCSQVGYTCPEWFPDLAFDLMLPVDAGVSFDGGMTGTPRDASRPASCDAGGVLDASMDGSVGDAGLDARADGGLAGGPGCGCRSGSRPGAPGLAHLAGALVAWRGRRRRRGVIHSQRFC